MKVACIVEGHGDVEAVPLLLGVVLAARAPQLPVEILRRPHRLPRGKMVKEGELTRAVSLQANRVRPDGAVLVALDADDECAAKLGPTLQRVASEARPDVRVGVVVAVREFEAWLVASARTLSGACGLPSDLAPPMNPETLANPKGWLGAHMKHRLSETVDQPKLTSRLDVDLAARVPSFRKLLRELGRLIDTELE